MSNITMIESKKYNLKKNLRIATRTSQLALQQTNTIKHLLQKQHPELRVELINLVTQGDKIVDRSLEKIGGKGLFTKELEQALLEDRADIAVHSMKDVPNKLPDGLIIHTICQRADPRDAFIANHYETIDDLPPSAKVGTSSLRRQSQLLAYRPDLNIALLRGNVDTRLKKLDANEYDAIILAAAGLQRLQLTNRIKQYLTADIMLPAVGQGAVGIECRADDHFVQTLLQPLQDKNTHYCLQAERAMNKTLGGSCHVPIGGYAELVKEQLTLTGLVASPDGKQLVREKISGNYQQAEELGVKLAKRLLSQGADNILKTLD